MPPTHLALEVRPELPPALARLNDFANDLTYSWDRRVRALFNLIDRELWHTCGHSPKVFLRRVAQDRLEAASRSLVFMQDFQSVVSSYDTYLASTAEADVRALVDPERDLIAYFCAEFGLHESMPIYSGGLGILAGDHCKAASDLGLPFVAVGMLYRAGYVDQRLDALGNQQLRYNMLDFDDLPVSLVRSPDGAPLRVEVALPGRVLALQVWEARCGHIRLVLLDADIEQNGEADRRITLQLYGGDLTTRIEQEMVLGIGGVRALRALGLAPTVWHINEGHAAFLILERLREQVAAGRPFAAALEQVAAATVFTTHTPVPAGHDVFPHELMRRHFGDMVRELGIDEERFLALGQSPVSAEGFNQTALALRGSRFHNGVSRIHGGVAAHCESYVWPQVPPDENPMDYVTNGIHVPTFLAQAWVQLFDLRFGSHWRDAVREPGFWNRLDDLPDATFWSVRQLLKGDLIREVRTRAERQHRRNGLSETEIRRLTRHLDRDRDVCILGFARRFATYKRATLLFNDPARLARILNDPERPALLVFAGKAHPRDEPGQQLIRTIADYSRRPEFEGRILLLEGYDMALARRLVSGVDVWLNTPEYPLEASGTSGMKAGINGVLNLSILDGWWAEGHAPDDGNGWGIAPHGPSMPLADRNRYESVDILDTLEHQVLPLYYERNRSGYPEAWVGRAKSSMKSILPRFSARRMVMEYASRFYSPASAQQRRLAEGGGAGAEALAEWKARVRANWEAVSLRLAAPPQRHLRWGDPFEIAVDCRLGALAPEDVRVELLLGRSDAEERFEVLQRHELLPVGSTGQGEERFQLSLTPDLPGLLGYRLRIFPHHPLLAHAFETGLMTWL